MSPGKPWTRKDKALLLEFYEQGLINKRIGERMDRPAVAVHLMLHKLGKRRNNVAYPTKVVVPQTQRNLRMSVPEWEAVNRKAQQEGVPVTRWIRRVVLIAAGVWEGK